MDDVREAIGIDKVDTSGSLIFIEEHHNADANFVLHAITSHCKSKNHMTCFVLFHNTFGHFHNIGMKLGYNLKNDLNKSVMVLEPLKIVAKNVRNLSKSSESQTAGFDIKSTNMELVKQLVRTIQSECEKFQKESESQKLYIIVDDLSHLFDIGLNIQEVWLFVRHIWSFTKMHPLLTLCLGTHVYKSNDEHCQPNALALAVRYSADVTIEVQALETGYSRSVSGKMIVHWKSEKERLQFKWPESMVYLYKLLDRQVKLFTPGSSYIM